MGTDRISKRVGMIRDTQFRRLIESEIGIYQGWRKSLEKNEYNLAIFAPVDTLQNMLASATRLRHLQTIYAVYYDYPPEDGTDG